MTFINFKSLMPKFQQPFNLHAYYTLLLVDTGPDAGSILKLPDSLGVETSISVDEITHPHKHREANQSGFISWRNTILLQYL